MNNNDFDINTVTNFFKYDYHDRGMVKWQGFYLSDHSAAIEKQKLKNHQKTLIGKPQSLNEIKNIIIKAQRYKKKVQLTLKEISVKNNAATIVNTRIIGVQDNEIFLDNYQEISIDEILRIDI